MTSTSGESPPGFVCFTAVQTTVPCMLCLSRHSRPQTLRWFDAATETSSRRTCWSAPTATSRCCQTLPFCDLSLPFPGISLPFYFLNRSLLCPAFHWPSTAFRCLSLPFSALPLPLPLPLHCLSLAVHCPATASLLTSSVPRQARRLRPGQEGHVRHRRRPPDLLR